MSRFRASLCSPRSPGSKRARPCGGPARVAAAIAAIADGETVLILDPAGGGHLAVAGDRVEAAHLALMAEAGRGPLGLALSAERCGELGLEPRSRAGSSPRRRTIASIDAAAGLGSGSSAGDRARTIRVAADPAYGRADVVEGGHVNVVMVAPRGVIARPEAAEAAVDLARQGGRRPAAAICTVLGPDGSIAGRAELQWLARRHRLQSVEIPDLLAYRWCFDLVLEREAEVAMPTAFGEFRLIAFGPLEGKVPHLALVRGEPGGLTGVPLAVQRECRVGNALRSRRCACRRRLESAMRRIGGSQRGVLLHLADEEHEADGSLAGSLRHLAGAECSYRAEELDARRGGVVKQMLVSLGVRSVTLLDDGVGAEACLRRLGVDMLMAAPGEG